MSEIRKCAHCREEFKTYPSQPKKFCNKKCFADFFRGKPGRIQTEAERSKRSKSLKGRVFSAATLALMAAAHKGKNIGNKHGLGYCHSDEAKRRMSVARTGKKRSLEARKNISNGKKGEKCHFWKGGVSPINALIRNSFEYRAWRTSVFERDNFVCQHCGTRGGRLNADHIKAFAAFPELRFELSNGQTLCEPCHKKTPTYGNGSRKNFASQ